MHQGCKLHKAYSMFDSKFLTLYKILDWIKLKAFADNKLKVAKMIIFVFGSVENIVGKQENAGYSILSFFHNVFKKALTRGH